MWIPKSGGGQRGLGIPNVVDRMVQESVRQVLEPSYEPTFHASSHGFRHGRSCHTAIAEAVKHVEEGHEWMIDLDLEAFFDRVNHQRLMSRLAQRVSDKRLLVLIGRMLKAKVVMPNGVLVSTDEGVPQGGPLSPLLSNVVLDELDWELARRGHPGNGGGYSSGRSRFQLSGRLQSRAAACCAHGSPAFRVTETLCTTHCLVVS